MSRVLSQHLDCDPQLLSVVLEIFAAYSLLDFVVNPGREKCQSPRVLESVNFEMWPELLEIRRFKRI